MTGTNPPERLPKQPSFIDKTIRFCIENKLVVVLFMVFIVGWGWRSAPFDWEFGGLERDPTPVDAIPDIGENQQIVFTEWMGRSPQDVEDQIGYPLTVSLLGIPGVKTIRSYSLFGFSLIYIIFDEDVEFYWSRSRVLEKMSSLPAGTLPEDVQPALGPDATALGQVYWYTLEGQDKDGNPTGGWGLDELRTIQDWYVRYALLSAGGVSEVASIGGYVKEYQIDVDPDAMRAYGVSLDEVFMAVRMSNVDVGARTIEVNRVEYIIRGLGFVENLEDIEDAVVKVNDNVPIYVRNVANVVLGPGLRRGVLDKAGAEAAGGVVVVRYGENPLASIKNIKKKIKEISPGLPQKTLADGTVSQVKIVPFYDRSGLIYETLGTLSDALLQQVLVTIIVVVVMVRHLRSSILISGLLPLAVLMCFIAMRVTGVDANIVALSGIAIAIGTIVDMGIIVCENILKHLEEADPEANRLEVIYTASSEVGSAILTAVSTTIVSFLPVFTMEAAEGKLFRPLAFTKTYALLASVIVALTIIPPAAHMLFTRARKGRRSLTWLFYPILAIVGVFLAFRYGWWWPGALLVVIGLYGSLEPKLPPFIRKLGPFLANSVVILAVLLLLTQSWLPIGPEKGLWRNAILVGGTIGALLLVFQLFQAAYPHILRWALDHKATFMVLPIMIVIAGGMVWRGFDELFAWMPETAKKSEPAKYFSEEFPGLGKEFMPPLDEGSYLYMPVTMPHASIGEVIDVLQKQDIAFNQVPEVSLAVGKLGRVESPLDPAPLSMIETVINYHPKYMTNEAGHQLAFRYDASEKDLFRDKDGKPVPANDGEPYYVQGTFARDDEGKLIEEDGGMPFRQWRRALDPAINDDREAWPGVNTPNDIWDLIVAAGKLPGTTSAPKLQPIAARIVMLQSGMRAPMGVKVKGPSLEALDKVGLQIERFLKEVPSVEPQAVIADRIIGKPYLEIDIDRKAIARYGIRLRQVQDVIEVAIGGKRITTTVEGRERFPVRVRYLRELRDSIESLDRILVPAPGGAQIPLIQLAKIEYIRGPQVIKSEDTFLVGYVLFDMKDGYAEVEVVEEAKAYLESQQRVFKGAYAEASKQANAEGRDLTEVEIDSLPGLNLRGCTPEFAGTYENQVRSEKRLMIVLPLALFVIFMILYLQFRSMVTTSLVFTGILVAWSGGFLMIWFYAQPWFLDWNIFGTSMRELFQAHPINLSVAIWVGFLALFGIASDDGVVMATYLNDSFANRSPNSISEIRAATLKAGQRRIRPCLMTTATTILALLPVLTSSGRGSDIMVPMAIPSFGGMTIEIITMLVVPVLFCLFQEIKFKTSRLGAETAVSGA
ncbi:MAG: efflux RND transporter permease subunit [Planctomycetes bacterium]|nr:efflux RND transporter permease subunit [Planctomycetota bacterium]